MQHFQPILIIIGLLAIVAVLIHGYLISRKEKIAKSCYSEHEANNIDENDSSIVNDEHEAINLKRTDDESFDGPLINIKDDELETDDFVIKNTSIDTNEHSIEFIEPASEHPDSEINLTDEVVTSEKSTEDVLIEENNDNAVSNAIDEQDLSKPEEQSNKEAPSEDAQDIFIFNVVAKEDSYIRGHTLLQFFLTAGFRFGKMNIFHRHLHSDGTGPILFSIANMMAPGIFHPTKMKQLHSEGVSFFLTAPNDEINIKEAFDMMLVAVQQMADEFDCVVLNADREPMTEEQFREYHQRLLHYI